jgi:hypothetical protein
MATRGTYTKPQKQKQYRKHVHTSTTAGGWSGGKLTTVSRGAGDSGVNGELSMPVYSEPASSKKTQYEIRTKTKHKRFILQNDAIHDNDVRHYQGDENARPTQPSVPLRAAPINIPANEDTNHSVAYLKENENRIIACYTQTHALRQKYHRTIIIKFGKRIQR